MINLLDIAWQSAAIYLFVMVCLRVLGKKGLAELSVADLVLIILIGEALGSLIPQENAFVYAIVCIFTLAVMNYLLEIAVFKSKKIRKVIEGNPVVIVRNGKILKENLRREKLTIENLEEAVRSNGVKDISEVDIAVLETDGEISIIQKAG